MEDYKELFEQKGKFYFRTRYNQQFRHTIRMNTENFDVDVYLNGLHTKNLHFKTLDEAYNFFRR